MTLKRFLAFAGESYEPGGGWLNFVSDHETLQEAAAAARAHALLLQEENSSTYAQVVDTETRKIVLDKSLHRHLETRTISEHSQEDRFDPRYDVPDET